MDISRLGRGLAKDNDGIWRPANTRSHALSFPATGHGVCYQIEDESFWFAHRSACITSALARAHVGGPFLDVGGGNGAVSKALERANGLDVVLIEPGAEGARGARRRGIPHVICATLEELDIAPSSFGSAGLFDVAEHVADDRALFRQVHRVLQPGGLLCVTVPAYSWLWSAEDELAEHHRRYTLAGLMDALAGSGFSLRYATYLFAAFTVPVFLLRSVPHKMVRRSKDQVEHRAAEQHRSSALVRRIIDAALAPELAAVRAGRRIPFGTSCLAVAEKT